MTGIKTILIPNVAIRSLYAKAFANVYDCADQALTVRHEREARPPTRRHIWIAAGQFRTRLLLCGSPIRIIFPTYWRHIPKAVATFYTHACDMPGFRRRQALAPK